MPPLLLLLAVLAGPASATGLEDLDRLYRKNGVDERLLHARTIPKLSELGGADEVPGLEGFLPVCGKGEASDRIPPRYEDDYKAEGKVRSRLGKALSAARRYADARQALADGYLPGEEYEPGVGVPFAHPGRVKDPKVALDKPEMLFYVKERARQKYRLVGLAYLAAGTQPKRELELTRAGSRELIGNWRPWNELCFKTEGGLARYEDGEAGRDCEGGKFFPSAWAMSVWLPLYNPLGLLTPRNPLVDHLDLGGKTFPPCRGRAK